MNVNSSMKPNECGLNIKQLKSSLIVMTLIAFAINSTKYLNLKISLGTAVAPA